MINEKPKKNKKRFKDTKVFKFLKNKTPNIFGEMVSLAGDITDIKLLNKIGAKIKGSKELSADDKLIALNYLQYDLAELEAVTSRWSADMLSDNWLSKSVRPMTLIYLVLFISVLIFIDSIDYFDFEVKDSYISLLQMLLLTVVGGYFGLKTIEKRNDKKY